MSKKYEFDFDVSALTDFKNENTGLVAELMYKPTTIASGIEVMVGEKGVVKLNNLSNDIYLQAAACGWNVSGSTTFGQEEVVVETLDLKEALCPKDLTSKWMSQVMRDGSNPEEVPFEGFILESKTAKLSNEIEKMFWQGNKATGSGNLSLVDGFLDFIDGKATSATTVATTKATVIDNIEAVINKIPEEVLEQEDIAIYINPANFRFYINALIASQYPVNAESTSKAYGKSIMVPGYNVEVIMTSGLIGLDKYVASSKKNMVLVTDLLSDSENIEIWYSKDNDEYRIKATFKMGVGSYFPSLVVLGEV